MRVRSLVVSVAVVLIALFAVSTTALAGSWATADDIVVADEVTAGEPFRIDFTLNQHGVTPVHWPDAYFTAMSDAGETVTFDAEPTGKVGMWFVNVTLPRNGVWTWDIQTNDLMVERSYHVLKLPRTSDAVAGVSQADLDNALAGMSERVESLEAEQQALTAQIATLEAAQVEDAANTPPAWWITASIAAVATILLTVALIALAIRHGTRLRFDREARHAG